MLSVIIIAKNEEVNLRRCLHSVQWADEIIVLDSGSTDNTVAIAKEYTQQVHSTDWPGYGIQKQRALALATGDWVLNLDADEAVDQPLKEALLSAIAEDKADAYRIPICMNFYNKPLPHCASPKRHIRLFKRKGAFYSNDIVHEKIILPEESRISKISQPIMHHSFQDVSHVLYKINRYSSYSAKIKLEKNKSSSLTSTLLRSGAMFFRCYLLQRGFLDGKAGFLFAIFSAQGTFYRGVKQLYLDAKINELPRVKWRLLDEMPYELKEDAALIISRLNKVKSASSEYLKWVQKQAKGLNYLIHQRKEKQCALQLNASIDLLICSLENQAQDQEIEKNRDLFQSKMNEIFEKSGNCLNSLSRYIDEVFQGDFSQS